jgi:hypothetical protein
MVSGGNAYMKTLDCTDCSHCCNYITFTISKVALDLKVRNDLLDYYNKRGFTVKQNDYSIFVTIFSPCVNMYVRVFKPHHGRGAGCQLHNTDQKPAICRKYDCREDQHLPPGGNYEKGKDRP